MTQENKALRSRLKAAESVIVDALASQPDNDSGCRLHLERALTHVVALAGGVSFAAAQNLLEGIAANEQKATRRNCDCHSKEEAASGFNAFCAEQYAEHVYKGGGIDGDACDQCPFVKEKPLCQLAWAFAENPKEEER